MDLGLETKTHFLWVWDWTDWGFLKTGLVSVSVLSSLDNVLVSLGGILTSTLRVCVLG